MVDYIGVAQNLRSALDQYSGHDREQTGIDEAEAVKVLLEKETLDRKEVDQILADVNRKLGIVEDIPMSDDSTTPPPTYTTLDGGKIVVEEQPEKLPSPRADEPPPGLQPKFA